MIHWYADLSDLRSGEGLVGGLAVLARQITDLAGFRKASIARRCLAADEGVHVSASASAVAVGGNGIVVDVVH